MLNTPRLDCNTNVPWLLCGGVNGTPFAVQPGCLPLPMVIILMITSGWHNALDSLLFWWHQSLATSCCWMSDDPHSRRHWSVGIMLFCLKPARLNSIWFADVAGCCVDKEQPCVCVAQAIMCLQELCKAL
jgi:hypothetical protein